MAIEIDARFAPETSGSLLIAVPREKLEVLIGLFAEEWEPCWVVGEVMEGRRIEVVW